MIIAEISKMSLQDRLQIMEALWDSLTHDQVEIKPPEWHKDILTERGEKIKNGKASFISLDELKSKNNK